MNEAFENLVTDNVVIEAPETGKPSIFYILGRATLKGLARLLGLLPTSLLRIFLARLVAAVSGRRSPEESLRFLFRLDADLYAQQGLLSQAYGQGLHTKHRHIRYHDFFIARIKAHERVLDIGCGNGALTQAIAKNTAAAIMGIDIEPDNISQAKSKHAHSKINYLVGDALAHKFEREFDVVVLSNVLEHLPHRPSFLKALAANTDVTRFLIRVPVFERDWRVPLKRELGVEWRLDKTHETEFTPEGFKAEMGAAGLRITHFEIRWGEIWAEIAV